MVQYPNNFIQLMTNLAILEIRIQVQQQETFNTIHQ